jgi:hypothetical protein
MTISYSLTPFLFKKKPESTYMLPESLYKTLPNQSKNFATSNIGNPTKTNWLIDQIRDLQKNPLSFVAFRLSGSQILCKFAGKKSSVFDDQNDLKKKKTLGTTRVFEIKQRQSK